MQDILPCKKPEKLLLANLPTPLKPLPRLSSRLQEKQLWLKCDDFTGSLVSGNKVRKLEYLLYEAQRQGADTVITCGGLQSNHCRATAALCAQLGLRCHLILRADKNFDTIDEEKNIEYLDHITGNLLLSELCGALISVFSPAYYQCNLDAIFDKIRQRYTLQNQKCYAIPTGGSNALGLWGYVDCYEELIQQCQKMDFLPDAIVCASGSGGTQGGLTLGAYLNHQDANVYGMAVCDSSEYFNQKIQQDLHDWQTQFSVATSCNTLADVQVNTIDKYIGPGYAKGFDELFTMIGDIAKVEGVVFDPVYTGKAFYGMLQEIKHGCLRECKNIVFVHTGGIYGVFPFAENLSHGYV